MCESAVRLRESWPCHSYVMRWLGEGVMLPLPPTVVKRDGSEDKRAGELTNSALSDGNASQNSAGELTLVVQIRESQYADQFSYYSGPGL